MRRVGLFGGSFNPPHVAHQLVALYVLETLVDEVWFVPTYSHPFGKDLAAYDHRIAMSMALVGLRRPGLAILDPRVVAKSWPEFWGELAGWLEFKNRI